MSASRTSATCSRRMGLPAFLATIKLPKSVGRCKRAWTCTTNSRALDDTVPTGASWFSERKALAICSAVTPRARIACGLSSIWIARSVLPTKLTAPTPRTFSIFLRSTWSAQLLACDAVSALGTEASRVTATEKMGRLAGSNRWMRGSSTSSRRLALTAATFSRTSSAAFRLSTSSWNSAMTTEAPW